jgi:hypothetical protein
MILAELFLSFQEGEEPLATVRYPCEITLRELKAFLAPLVGVPWNPQQNTLFIFSGSGGFPFFVGFENDHKQPLGLSEQEIARLVVQFREDLNEETAKARRPFLIYLVRDRITISNISAVCYPPEMTIGAVLQNEGITGNILLSESYGTSIGNRLTLETILKDFHGSVRVDLLPADWNLGEMRLIPVFVAPMDRTPGRYFWFDLRPDEDLANARVRACSIVHDLESPRVRFEVRFKEQTEERMADTVVLWNLYEALRQIDIERLRPRRPDGPGIVIRNSAS